MTGVYWTINVKVCPGFSVTGRGGPDNVNPSPARAAALIVSGAVPLELSVTNCGVAAVFTCTLPKARLAAPTVSVGTAAFNCRANVFEAPVALAVNVTAWAVPTDEIVAGKPALVAPAGTAKLAGTTTAALLLASVTSKPPLGAASFSATTQESVADPVMEEFVHESPVRTAGAVVPVPVKSITVTAPVEELLEIVT